MTGKKSLSPIKKQGTGFKNTFSSANVTQKKKENQPNVQKTKNNKTSQQNQKKNTNEGTKKKSVHKQTANSEEDSDIEQMSRVPHPKEEAKLNSNPLEIVFINGNITTCSGCNFKYKDSERREAYDLVFKICMHCMRPFHLGTIWA